MPEFIHERPNWPEFTWDASALSGPLADVRHKQGRLLGSMDALGFDVRLDTGVSVLTADVVTSSAIEGETLDVGQVRSSIARRLGLETAGLPKAGRDVEGIVEMMLDATRNCDAPLDRERLFAWHAALFPTGRSGLVRIAVGAWRTGEAGPMQVVSGPLGSQTVHYEAPEAERVPGEMQRFLDWFNGPSTVDPVLRAGIAHFWFVTIHPFEDGNGRIARAIADMALARADRTKERFYSMSAQIEAQRNDYYRELETNQRGDMDITSWLAWFLACLDRAVDSAEATRIAVLQRASAWQRFSLHPLNERQRLVVNRMLSGFQGFMSTAKYATLAKCSTDTALRDIQGLLEHGVLVRNASGGRSTSYRLAGDESGPGWGRARSS